MDPFAPFPFNDGSDRERRRASVGVHRLAGQQLQQGRRFVLDRDQPNRQANDNTASLSTTPRMAVQAMSQQSRFILERDLPNQQSNHDTSSSNSIHRMAMQPQQQSCAFVLDRDQSNQQVNHNAPLGPTMRERLSVSNAPAESQNPFLAPGSIGRGTPASPNPFSSLQRAYSLPVAAASSVNIYTPLLTPDSIRLLQILPGKDEPLKCSLRAYKLQENEGKYEALSYTWVKDGPNELPVEILVNDSKLSIRRNLYDALRRLRMENKPRTVWADAICINQDNQTEKSQQVKKMDRIFAKAWRVVVWLGLNDDVNVQNQSRPELFSETISSAFSGVCSIVNLWLIQNGHHGTKAEYTSPTSEQVFGEPGRDFDQTLLNQVFPLFNRGWFTRTWVIQEAALARSVTVMWGGYEIPWDWVGLAAAIIKDNQSDSSLSRMQSAVSEYQSIPVGVVNAYFMYRISESQTFLPPLEFSFLQLLQLTRKFGCKSGHDRIYALSGLPTTDSIAEKIVPNYEKNIHAVYEELARLILLSDMSLAILSSVGHSLVLPSWVPTWHLSAPDSLRPMMPHAEFQCGAERPRQIRLFSDKSTLESRGILVDEVTAVFSDETNSFCWNFAPSMIAHQSSKNAAENAMSTREAFQALAMTLTGGLEWRGYPVDAESNLANFSAAFLSQAMNWRALGNVLPLAGLPNAFTAETLTDLEKLAQNGEAAPYVNAVRATLVSHVIFTTKSGMIGVGPANGMKVGDQLSVLFGANVPFLLRGVENGYLIVGECYVYNIMHGEAIRRLSDTDSRGRLHETWLTLL